MSLANFLTTPILVIMALFIIAATNLESTSAAEDFGASWLACDIQFTDIESKVKVVKDCADKTKFKLDLNSTFETIQDLMKELSSKDFDDGCFTKCWYEELKLIEADGKVKTSVIDTFYKTSNITEALHKEIKAIFEGCVKATEAKFKDAKEVPCKMYTQIEFCVFEKVVEKRKTLEEACKKKN